VIAELTGTVRALAPDGVILTVGGVGLQVQCTPRTLARLRVGVVASLATALVVREDSLTLYGFLDADEKAVFEVLQTATGVGPRLAQAVLGALDPEAIRLAIAHEDLTALTTVPGVGRKLAQRLVLELKDRLGAPHGSAMAGAGAGAPDVREGLLALGYSLREADEALASVTAAHAAAGPNGTTAPNGQTGPTGPTGPNGQTGSNAAAAPAGPDDPAALLKAALGVLRRR
jgi:Holliday junction DNA helicase RuvA